MAGTAHFVFLTIAVAYAALFVGFLVNARLGERVERREVLFFAGVLFAAAWTVAWLVPNLWVIAGVLCRQPDRHRVVPVQPVQLHRGGLSDPDPVESVCLDGWAGTSGRLGRGHVARPALCVRAGPSWLDAMDHHSRRVAAGGADQVRRHTAVAGGAGADFDVAEFDMGMKGIAEACGETAMMNAFIPTLSGVPRDKPWRLQGSALWSSFLHRSPCGNRIGINVLIVPETIQRDAQGGSASAATASHPPP